MQEERKKIAIDADYFNKFTEMNPDGQLFLKVMDEFQAFPVMQEYVYSYELAGNPTARLLVEQGKMQVLDYSDYLPDNKSNYENMFLRAYQALNFQHFDTRKCNVYTYHHEKENLGEIRTALMAFYLRIEVMMSDDGGAKSYISKNVSSRRHPLTVYNIFETLMMIGRLSNRRMKWGDIKGMSKRIFSKDLYEKINEAWH